jgi:hypothetical protein
VEPPTNACWKRRAALKGTSEISARSSVHHDSLSVRPRQPEVSVFPRDATLRFTAVAAVFRPGEPRTAVRVLQAALVVNHRRGRQKSRRSGFFAMTLCDSAFPNRGEKSKSSSSFRRSPARPSPQREQGNPLPIVANPRLSVGLLWNSDLSVRGGPYPESRRCSGTDPSQRIGRRRQDAGAQSASSERRPWMAVANVRRRGMGSPEPSRRSRFWLPARGPVRPTCGRWRFRCGARSCRAGRR